MNTTLRMILVLGLIAAVSAGLLAGVNMWTSPIISENSQIRLTETLSKVIDADEFIEQEDQEYPLWHAEKNGKLVGYVVRLIGQGYSSAGIDILVGLNEEAEVQGVYIFSHSETPGLGDKVAGSKFLTQFAGKGIDDPIASGTDIDAISGATSSSVAVIGSVRRAVQFVGKYAGLIESTEIDFAEIPDGVYSGTGRGFGGDIAVEVTFEGGRLTKVTIVSHNETKGISDPAFNKVPQAMVDEQSIEVDTVSGATMTSEGIIAAVLNALAEFGGGGVDTPINIGSMLPGKYTGSAKGLRDGLTVEVRIAAGRIEGITVISHNETPDYADPAFAALIPSIIDAQDLDVDLVSGATFSSEGLINAIKKALRSEGILDVSGLGDGEYTGEANGFSRNPIRVSFVVKAGKIESMEVLSHSDTPDYANPAFKQLIDAILDSQSLDVDLVSGATYSSEGMLAAVVNAMKNGPALDVTTLPDGVYEGSARGYAGDIKVQVTVASGTITKIIVVDHNDTPEYAGNAFALINVIYQEQALDVDVISGATGSSRGLLDAIEAALSGAAQ